MWINFLEKLIVRSRGYNSPGNIMFIFFVVYVEATTSGEEKPLEEDLECIEVSWIAPHLICWESTSAKP